METKELFTRMLHLPEEWEVYEVTYEEPQQQIHLKIRYLKKKAYVKGQVRYVPFMIIVLKDNGGIWT